MKRPTIVSDSLEIRRPCAIRHPGIRRRPDRRFAEDERHAPVTDRVRVSSRCDFAKRRGGPVRSRERCLMSSGVLRPLSARSSVRRVEEWDGVAWSNPLERLLQKALCPSGILILKTGGNVVAIGPRRGGRAAIRAVSTHSSTFARARSRRSTSRRARGGDSPQEAMVDVVEPEESAADGGACRARIRALGLESRSLRFPPLLSGFDKPRRS